MNKYELIKIIENFAPLETQEKWDCSGWLVDTKNKDVNKIMLALTVTDDILKQALEQNCDMIISHHPLFFIPTNFLYLDKTATNLSKVGTERVISNKNYSKIDIYCAHTNMDIVQGGTTDTLINEVIKNFAKISARPLFESGSISCQPNSNFVRYLKFESSIKVSDFSTVIKHISPNARFVNNRHTKNIQKIAFCAGSGSEFINEACGNGADCFVTGDLKFHTALDSPIMVYDIGHFESEIWVLQVFEKLLKEYVEIVFAEEKSPFEQICS